MEDHEEDVDFVPLTVMEELAKPFDPGMVKKRVIIRGKKDFEVDYIPGNQVIARLNEVFGGQWSFTISEKIVDIPHRQVAVLGRMEVRAATLGVESDKYIVKEQWGGVYMNVYESGQVVCLGDDLKIATTDALKKCATLFGVALYLYDQDQNVDVVSADKTTPAPVAVSPDAPEKGESVQEPASQVKIAAIEKMIETYQLDKAEVLKSLGVESLQALSSGVAAQFLIQRHPFWATLTPSTE